MRIEDLTPEQIEQAKGYETVEERMAFLRDNGVELNDEQLDAIVGGGSFGCIFGYHGAGTPTGNTRTIPIPGTFSTTVQKEYLCPDCGDTYWC